MDESKADVSVSESGGRVGSYQTEWAADVVSADGRTVRIRPIRAHDSERVLQLYERLSPESMYLRFFSPVPAETARRTEHLTQVDQDEHVVIVAEMGDELVAMARYDRQPPGDTAEVAFVVDDAHQRRGLGTLLLEHLAAIGRGEGLRQFVATTLPQNRQMLAVFRDAGYEVTSRFEQGTIEVSFSIGTTDASLAAQQAREHRAEAESIAGLLTPSSIALIGASRRPGTIGHEILRNLLDGGFTGPVYPVNPNARAVTGVRAYPTIGDIPDDVDLAVVAVPATEVPTAVRQCAAKRVRSLVIVSAGFAEVGGDQAHAERDLVEVARRNGMRIVGPNCMGVINTSPAVHMNATFAPFVPTAGRIAFSSQSGALGIELLGQTAELGLGISTFVSVGNKADVSGNDLLQYWEDDADTDVILLYLESFGNPRKFAAPGAPYLPDEADRRRQEWSHPGGNARRRLAHRRPRQLGRRRRRALPAGGRDPSRHARGAVRCRSGSRAPTATAGPTRRHREQRGRSRDPRRRRVRGRGPRGAGAQRGDTGEFP